MHLQRIPALKLNGKRCSDYVAYERLKKLDRETISSSVPFLIATLLDEQEDKCLSLSQGI